MHSCQLLGFGVLTVGETSKVTSIRTKGFVAKFYNQLFGRRKTENGVRKQFHQKVIVHCFRRRKSLQHSTFGMNFSSRRTSKWVKHHT